MKDLTRSLIDRAAEALGKDRTEFMLDAATREAQSVLYFSNLIAVCSSTNSIATITDQGRC